MIIGTFNGWNIIGMPDSPGIRQVQWDLTDLIGEVASPYSGAAQQQDWMTDFWQGMMTLPPMSADQAGRWRGFLAELRGKLNVFPLSDPYGLTPSGAANGEPLCAGQNLSRARVLNTKGWAPSIQAQLKVGDYLQIGKRLHMVIGQDVDSDEQGDATINIWPSVREGPNEGDPIILNNPAGLFRLKSNKRSWTVGPNRLFSVSYEIKEAL